MSIAAAAAISLALLLVMGMIPSVAVIGPRWIAITAAPIVGAVITSLASSAALAVGGPMVLWCTLLSLVAGAVGAGHWIRRPDRRPWRALKVPSNLDRRAIGILAIGTISTLLAAAWSLRGLATETIGFDTRALWALRSGWLLHDHAQMLLDFKIPEFLIGQSGYPPLVSAEGALAWGATGVHSARLEVVVVALVDMCGLLTVAGGLLMAARSAASAARSRLAVLPALAGGIAAVSIVVIGAGITTPFLTNGYADPMWSICAAGAVLFGLILPNRRPAQATAALLLIAAGMSKQEGLFTALCIIVLIVGRQVGHLRSAPDRRRRIALVAGVAVTEVIAIAAWPTAIALTGSRQVTSPLSPSSQWPHRAHEVIQGFAPSLHVLVLALLISCVGGFVLSRVRRDVKLGNDLWSWAGLMAGLCVVGGVLTTGSAAIVPWIEGSVHRVTQFPVLCGWLIVGAWLITAAVGLAGERSAQAHRST